MTRPPTDDDPVTLKEACEIVFRNTCTVSTLRAAADRGTLEVSRIGKRLYTTLAAARELYAKCRVEKRRQGFTLIRSVSNGSSETDRASSAQAALSQTVRELKSSLRNTSDTNTNRSAARRR